MLETELRFTPPTSRCAYVDCGTIARSLFDVSSDELSGSSTPLTSSFPPLWETVWPSGFVAPNSWVTVSGPRTTTGWALLWSRASMNRPADTVRDRTTDHSGVVPWSDVVQLVEPRTSSAFVVETGATVCTSGATDPDRSAAASCIVSVD